MIDFTHIHSFDSVTIAPRTLVLCDIDNTLLYSMEDENSRSLYTRLYYHYLNATKNMNAAVKLTDNAYYAQYPMRATDPAGFERMLLKIRETEGCELVFLTARNSRSVDFTRANFLQIGLRPEDYMVHFSDTVPKGEYTNRYLKLAPYRKIVFIDDLRENLQNMRMHARHPNLELFLFQCRK